RRVAKQLAHSRTARELFKLSAISSCGKGKGSFMKSRTIWRWNPVRGEYESGDTPLFRGTGEISAIDVFTNKTIFVLGGTGVVVNLAGVVDLHPPVNESFETNVYGVQHLIELVKLIDAKLVHVSTSYVAGKKNGRIPEDTPIVGYFPLRDANDGRQFSVAEEL